MGRAGITLLDVENAAQQLQGRGKTPTVDAIRELLGTGSKSTIIQHLKTWRSKQDESQGNLPTELLSLVTGLWERLNGQAEQRIAEIEAASEIKLQELKQILGQSQRDHTEIKSKLHQIEESLSIESRLKTELEKQLQCEKQDHEKLNERYQACVQQIENHKQENIKLHQLAANIQANLEHYQQAMQQARIEQSLAIESQRATFQQEIAELQRELISYRKHNQELEHQYLQKEALLNQIRQQHDALQLQYQNQIQQLSNATHELIIYKERCEQQHIKLSQHESEIKQKSSQLQDSEKQLAILHAQCTQFRSDLAIANDKIEFLREEKLFLLQEKAALQEYIKFHEKQRKSVEEQQ